ncbi:MAG: Flp pilus assembly complex ATPase component TadA, partial [Acetatifactor sp.]|nr:Flp pilus assembly complex ATPase component TadA [Acetatifactor sp.]
MTDLQSIKQKVRDRVREKMDYGRDYQDDEVGDLIDEEMLESPEMAWLSLDQRLRLKRELFDSMRRLDVLQIFVEDPSVTEIMINGMDNIFVERAGKLSKLELSFDSEERLKDVIQQIVAGCNRVVNEASPIVDARLSDGARVNVVMDPVALNGPIVTIRRFPKSPITMEQLLAFGSISKEAMQFLEQLVLAHYNIFISG